MRNTLEKLHLGLGPVIVVALAVAVIAWAGYELSQWPPPPPSSSSAGSDEGSAGSGAGGSGRSGGDRAGDEPKPEDGAEPSSSPSLEPASGQWVLFGDSYADGVGADRPGFTGFPQRLRECLDVRMAFDTRPGSGYVEAGLGGAVPGRVGPLLEDRKPGVAVFAAGLADRPKVGVERSVSVRALRAAASQAWTEAEKAGAEVVVVGPFWPSVTMDPGITMVRDALQAEAEEHGYLFVDIEGWLNESNLAWFLGPDGAHPTQRGHDYLAQRLADELEASGLAPSTSC